MVTLARTVVCTLMIHSKYTFFRFDPATLLFYRWCQVLSHSSFWAFWALLHFITYHVTSSKSVRGSGLRVEAGHWDWASMYPPLDERWTGAGDRRITLLSCLFWCYSQWKHFNSLNRCQFVFSTARKKKAFKAVSDKVVGKESLTRPCSPDSPRHVFNEEL